MIAMGTTMRVVFEICWYHSIKTGQKKKKKTVKRRILLQNRLVEGSFPTI